MVSPSSTTEINSSPYFLSTSDHPHHVLTPFLLTGANNYEKWAKLARNNLQAKHKLGFIDGSLIKPASDSSDLPRWIQTNSMLVGWLYASLDPQVQKSISFVDNAKLLWDNLKVRYSIGNASRVHELKHSLATCTQGGNEVAEYFGKLKIIWDDLDDYEPPLQCCCNSSTCPQMVKQIQRRDHERIHQFLMGLDASLFATTRTTLLSRLNHDASLTLDHVYSEIISEERHHTISRSKEERLDAVGFAVRNGVQAIASVTRTTPAGPCTHCGRTNHTMDTCFQLHGLPDWWLEKHGDAARRTEASRGRGKSSSRGRGRGRPTSRANNAQVSETPDQSDIPGISKETWSAIVNLLKSETSGQEKLSGKKDCVDFLLDSGASHHMTGDIDLLTDIHEIPRSIIVLPNGKHTYANREGSLVLAENITLSRVLYVADLSCTLISLARLLREISCFAYFTDKLCFIQDRITKTVIGAGEERDGVYHFRGSVPVAANRVSSLPMQTLWHRRLGHPSKRVLSTVLSTLDVFDSSVVDLNDFCEVCLQAKQTRSCFSESSNKAVECFSLIHCDIWGPYKQASSCGAHYFLTIVDDHSRAVWTHLLLAKSEVTNVLTNFIHMVKKQFNKEVKTIRSDNGTEFTCMRNFFRANGIIHQTSCVYTPQQNGRVERKHRHILNMARSLLFQANLPVTFWGESILAAAYLINRTPTPLLDNKSPYEVLHSKPPNYAHLRVFGSMCYAKKLTATRDKFQPRSLKCIFVGYSPTQKGWRVHDLQTGETFVSRDVVFNETVFPYSSSLTAQEVPSPPVPDMSNVESVPLPMPVSPGNTEDRGSSSDLVPAAADTSSSINPTPDLGTEPLGRGLRSKRPPAHLDSYVTYAAQCDKPIASLFSSPSSSSSGMCSHPLAKVLSLDRFSKAHQIFLAAVDMLDEPVTYKQAVRLKEWCDAMSKEVEALEENETWTLVPLPEGCKALGSKWVYRIKFNSDGTIERYKARLVALGNHQKEGIDFTDTFAPVVKMQTVLLLLSVAAAKGWELHQMDVHNAFLHGDIDEDIYMKPPPGFKTSDPNLVCKLKKSLYGLRQAPRCWFAKLSTALLDYGFTQSTKDYSFFAYNVDGIILHVLVYVDDLIVCGNNPSVIAEFKAYLSECFKMKDLGALKYFLGIEVARSSSGIFLCQRKYCLDIIDECGLLGSKPVDTPMVQQHNLAKSTSLPCDDPSPYRRLIGRLVYLTHTRPDITYAVSFLAQFMQTPLVDHWEAALRLVRYLKSSPNQGLLLSAANSLEVTAYCDSDFNTCPLTRKSVTGYFIMLGDSPIRWKSKKQSRVSLSSAEAEYRAMTMTATELLWIKEVLHLIGISHDRPMHLVCDSQAALHIASNPVFHERTKHIESDCHFIRDEITAGTIATSYVSTNDQPADLFTKALSRDQFVHLRSKLGVLDLHAPS